MLLSKTVSMPESQTLDGLLTLAANRKHTGLPYAGDVTPEEVYSYLKTNPGLLLDVRTPPEWQFTGTPDVTDTKGILATIAWKTYPTFAQNPQFIEALSTVKEMHRNTPVFCICRSGGRSLDAAVATTEAGYLYCFNVIGGYEGEPDSNGHRGTQAGWKAAQLPWRQA